MIGSSVVQFFIAVRVGLADKIERSRPSFPNASAASLNHTVKWRGRNTVMVGELQHVLFSRLRRFPGVTIADVLHLTSACGWVHSTFTRATVTLGVFHLRGLACASGFFGVSLMLPFAAFSEISSV